MPRFKKISTLYIIAISASALIAIVFQLLEAFEIYTNHYIKAIGIVVPVAIGAFESISRVVPSWKKWKERLMRRLGIPVEEVGDRTSINPSHRENIKNTLLLQVNEYCGQVLDNIKKSTIVLSQGKAIQTEQVLHPSFADFISDRRARVSNYEGLSTHLRFAITGHPGGGKTFVLTTTIKEKIDAVINERKSGNLTSQIPVYLSLNSWNNHVDFSDWVKERIPIEYKGCSPGNIDILLSDKEIAFFVDGLDEVPGAQRLACFKALLNYSEGDSVVFSCRKEPLLALLREDGLSDISHLNVLELRTLSNELITNVVRQQDNADEILEFIHSKQALLQFLDSPLRLNLFLRVFGSLNEEMKERIKGMDADQFEVFLWEKYDEIVLNERNADRQTGKLDWTIEMVRTYMVWLAKKMNGNTFFLDELQPAWLDRPHRIRLYYLTSRLISGVILAVSVGLFVAGPFDFIGSGIMASLFVVLLTLLLNKWDKEGRFPGWSMIVLFTLLLIVTTSAYQGSTVPRLDNDMYSFFSITESFAGILLGLFFGIVFGYRKGNQNASVDVRPLEQYKKRFRFNLRNALKTGLYGGLWIGFFLGVAAVGIHILFYQTTFDRWLGDNVNRFIAFAHLLFPDSGAVKYVQMAIFGFLAGFFIGFVVFSLMGGRDMESTTTALTEETDTNTSHVRLNLGMRKSLRYSLVYGFIVTAVLASTYGVFIFVLTREQESLRRAISVGAGAGIISLLWFGGFEVIQHWTLRFFLYAYGIIPFKYIRWVEVVQKSALIRQVGPSLQFYHPNLKKYYASISLNAADADRRVAKLAKPKTLALSVTGLVIVVAGLLLQPFIVRYGGGYWKQPDELRFANRPDGLTEVADGAFVANKKGILTVFVRGKVKVGTFTGNVSPIGTETGLLGFPLSDVYDVQPECRHGALIYQVAGQGRRTDWAHVLSETHLPAVKQVPTCIPLNAMDTVYFRINDFEWQNNRWHFNVRMSFDVTCLQSVDE